MTHGGDGVPPSPEEAFEAFFAARDEAGRVDPATFGDRLGSAEERRRFWRLVEEAERIASLLPVSARAGVVVGGRYRLEKEVGSGGFGKVWRAADERLGDRVVAVKILSELGASARSDLAREQRSLQSVQHLGIIQILDVGEHEGLPYLVLEFVDGWDLRSLVQRVGAGLEAGVEPDEHHLNAVLPASLRGEGGWFDAVLRLVHQLVEAVGAAHSAGVTHRDLNPKNAMVRRDGRVVLLDFGIANIAGEASGTMTSRLLGTPTHMAPEQFERDRIGNDPRTDVYQLGLVLYELLTLREPFGAKSVEELVARVRTGDFPRPSALLEQVPVEIERICLKAVELDPALRYATAVDMAEDLGWLIQQGLDRSPASQATPAMTGGERFEAVQEIYSDPRVVRWLAVDRELDCQVMIEQAGPAMAVRLGSRDGEKALREAKMVARQSHPNVCRFRERTEWRRKDALVLEVPRGVCLAEVVAREPMAADIAIRMGRDLAAGLQAVHAEGVVHRGVSAVNVFVDDSTGAAMISGFGFAKPMGPKVGMSSLDHRGRLSGEAAELGLPDYAAPEQMEGRPADHRADVFALGCLLYRAVTGREAFGDDPLAIPPLAHAVQASVSKPLSMVLKKCMQRMGSARYQNMLELGEALAACEQDKAEPLGMTGRARTMVFAAVLVVVVGFVLYLAGFLSA